MIGDTVKWSGKKGERRPRKENHSDVIRRARGRTELDRAFQSDV